MSTLSDNFEKLADAINSLDQYANPTVKITEPKVGLCVGRCINCGSEVKLQQPWLSKIPVVNDGWYLIHCENEDCHNYYGMELKDNQVSLADFVEWNEEYIVKTQETTVPGKVIPFRRGK